MTIQENADPDVVADLNAWFGRLVQERDPHFRHTLEGPDDMPAHQIGVGHERENGSRYVAGNLRF